MGFGEGGSLTKTKAIRVHRAARAALEAAGRQDGRIDKELWTDYIFRVANIGSMTQAKNFNLRMQRLGLLKKDEDGMVTVMPADYSDIILGD